MDPVIYMVAINIVVNVFAMVGVYVRIVERLTKVETNLEHLMRATGINLHKTEQM